jgi:plasmid maintenance system antidote protein VapI
VSGAHVSAPHRDSIDARQLLRWHIDTPVSGILRTIKVHGVAFRQATQIASVGRFATPGGAMTKEHKGVVLPFRRGGKGAHGSGAHGANLCPNCGPVGAGAQLLAKHGVAALPRGPFNPGAVAGRHFRGFVEPVVNVSGFNLFTSSSGDSGLCPEDFDGLSQGVLGAHGAPSISKLVCSVDANLLASKGRKILCMDTLGELVADWLERSGLKAADLADRINALVPEGARDAKVSRQHIERLVKAGNSVPRFILWLARAMGTTVDDLLTLQRPPALGEARKPPTPKQASPGQGEPLAPDFTAREFSESDWATLEAVKMVLPSEELARIRLVASRINEKAEQVVRERMAAATANVSDMATRRSRPGQPSDRAETLFDPTKDAVRKTDQGGRR